MSLKKIIKNENEEIWKINEFRKGRKG